MAKFDRELNRLLQMAAPDRAPAPEMPYGFETRVVALARAARSAGQNENWQLTRFLRRIALTAVIVTACASSAAYWLFSQDDELNESFSNAYAIADTAIEASVFQ